ncbi:hypothetical protein EOD42_06015 [Rhodovarius crocodyli]|uniref:Uncharacterized protein n=1 Tax=Rhodovarius crocodyli TaxID=1979269 RepID=A0A437MIB0_9PROT|nr:hypothetical protein [Rhodovarius crocodyli]RVT97388.1 hypothetical protein EOD42_06015 [Rhodovarius crocodyli]
MSDAPRNWADDMARRQPMRASSNMAPKPMQLPNLPRRLILIGAGLTGSILLASGIIWGISRMGPSAPPVIESDGRPFRVRPDGAPVAPPAVTTAAPVRPGEARVAQGPEAPRLDSLRQQMAAPHTPAPAPEAPAAAPRAAAPEQPAAPAGRHAQHPAPAQHARQAPAAAPARPPPVPSGTVSSAACLSSRAIRPAS